MKIERDKVYLTRNGDKVRILCIDAPGEQPIIGVDLSDGDAEKFNADGGYYPDGQFSGRDLNSEYTPPAPLLECWVNVSPSGDYGAAWESESAAQESCRDTTCRTVHFREVRDDHA
jgi:hypothetical protein